MSIKLVEKLKIGVSIFDGLSNQNDFIRNFLIQAEMLECNEAKQKDMINLMVKGKALRICEAMTKRTEINFFFAALKEKCALGADVALQRFYALNLLWSTRPCKSYDSI